MNLLLTSVQYGIAKAACVILVTGFLFMVSANIIGTLNFELNAKRSLRFQNMVSATLSTE